MIGCSQKRMPDRSIELPGAQSLTGRSFESFHCASALMTSCPSGFITSAPVHLACSSVELIVPRSQQQRTPSSTSRGSQESRCRLDHASQTAPSSSMYKAGIFINDDPGHPQHYFTLRATWQHHHFIVKHKSGHWHITTRNWNKQD